jgi:hypothetical protein
MKLFDLFCPKWRHPDYQVRLKAIKSLGNQSVLAKIAMNDSNAVVRKAAVEMLNDQAVLAEVAKNDNDILVRKAAIKAGIRKISDQTTLVKLAMNDSNDSVREAAVENITDQIVLAEIAKKDSRCFVRETAVKKITDQTILANLVMDESYDHPFVRDAAVEMIIDQVVLTKIAKNASEKNMRISAIKKIIDQSVLTEIFKNETDFSVRIAAIKKVNDQAVLTEIVKNESNFSIRKAALENLTNQSALAEIANSESNFNVSYAAFDKIKDQMILANLAKYGNGYLRMASISKLNDQALLAEIAKNDSDKTDSGKSVRETAVEKLTDQTLLVEIAKNDSDFFVREVARQKISDRSIITGIAGGAKNKPRTLGWPLLDYNKIIEDVSTHTFATGVVRPLTTALFFDYLWIPKDILNFIREINLPKDALDLFIADPISSSKYHFGYMTNAQDAVWYEDNKKLFDNEYVESHIELFRGDHDSQPSENIFFPSKVFGTKYRDKALREISHLYKSLGIPLIPVYHNPSDYDSVCGSEQTGLELCLDFIPVPLEYNLSWEQVLQFRKDKDAREKLLRLRRLANVTLSGYTHSKAMDEIAKRVDEYEWALKKHGIETVVGGITSVLSFAAGPTAVQLLSGNLYAAVAAGVTVGSAVLVWVKDRLIEQSSIQRSEVAYIYEVRKLDESVNIITSPNI